MKPLQPAISTDAVKELIRQAIQLHQSGQLEKARPIYQQILQIRPDHIDANHLLGVVLREAGEYEAALKHLNLALSLHQKVPEIWGNRAMTYQRLNRHADALQDFDQALQIDPRHALTWFNKAPSLASLGLPEQALEAYFQAEAHHMGAAGPLLNAGLILQQLDRHYQALVLYRQACRQYPNEPLLRWNLALLCLLLGLYKEGWQLYAERMSAEPHRIKHLQLTKPPYTSQAEWRGEHSIAGKTIFTYCEQGIGDTMQFVRYVPILEQLGAKVILGVQQELLRLFKNFKNVHLLKPGETLPPFDVHCPLLTLPTALGTDLTSVPQQIPYLFADATDLQKWAVRLGPARRPRVGFCWNGGTHGFTEEQVALNKVRNMGFAEIAAINIEGIDFFSLQKGKEAQHEFQQSRTGIWPQSNLFDWTDELHDFADTAALIGQLDLVISVDTSVVHLAAAMGKPVWLLNRKDTCWRWQLNRSDSIWYPGVLTQYRQHKQGDWAELMQRVRADLSSWRLQKEHSGSSKD